MLVISILFLLLSNAVTVRRDKSILFSITTIIIFINCCFVTIGRLYITYLYMGLALYKYLYYLSYTTHTFHLFIFIPKEWLSLAILAFILFNP